MDKEIAAEFQSLRDFLKQHMITKQELNQVLETLPRKQDFDRLLTAVDGIARQFKDDVQERSVAAERSSRTEAWITKAASKIGIDYRP